MKGCTGFALTEKKTRAAILLDLACPDPNTHGCGRQQDTKSSRLQMSTEDIYDFAHFSGNIKKG